MPEQTLYDVLGVTPDATAEEVKAAHRRHLKYWHPDRRPGPDAPERAKSINSAYDVLSDPSQRDAYDRKLAAGAPSPPPPAPPDAGPPPWTPPPGSYRRRRSASTSGTGSASGGPRRASTGPPPPPPAGPWDTRRAPGHRPASPPPPTADRSGGSASGPDAAGKPTSGLEHVAHWVLAWLVEPFRQPSLRQPAVAALALRATVVAAVISVLWLAAPYIVDAVSGLLDLLVIGAVLAFLIRALTRGGTSRRRRRRRR
jgi:curved DNA-binding protein CbpA